MKYLGTSLAIAATATLLLAGSSFAAGNTKCQPIYGGGETCVTEGKVKIDKKVSHPQTGVFVDNLGTNVEKGTDPRYAPGQTVNFQLIVTNVSGSDIAKVTIKDIFPQYVTFVSGVGSFTVDSKTLSFEVLNLKANESRTFTVTGKVADASTIITDQGVVCVVNQAQVLVNSNLHGTDNAQFCILKSAPSVTTKGGLKVFPPAQVKTTPSTGPEAIALAALLPSGLLGMFLRKKAL